MNHAAKVLLAGLLSALATASSAASVTGAGLHGPVEKGPIRPVCPIEESCDAPAQVTLLFSRTTTTGEKTYSVRSKPTGAYRIELPSGYYAVTTKERIGISRNIRPSRVHVRANRWSKANFFIDTGIR